MEGAGVVIGFDTIVTLKSVALVRRQLRTSFESLQP
jgi:hypothetical protein